MNTDKTMIELGTLIEIGLEAHRSNREHGDRARSFVCKLIGHLEETVGEERAKALAWAIGFEHLYVDHEALIGEQ